MYTVPGMAKECNARTGPTGGMVFCPVFSPAPTGAVIGHEEDRGLPRPAQQPHDPAAAAMVPGTGGVLGLPLSAGAAATDRPAIPAKPRDTTVRNAAAPTGPLPPAQAAFKKVNGTPDSGWPTSPGCSPFGHPGTGTASNRSSSRGLTRIPAAHPCTHERDTGPIFPPAAPLRRGWSAGFPRFPCARAETEAGFPASRGRAGTRIGSPSRTPQRTSRPAGRHSWPIKPEQRAAGSRETSGGTPPGTAGWRNREGTWTCRNSF